MEVANTLAYNDAATITVEKRFIVDAPGHVEAIITTTNIKAQI
jgi:hypothetical protein